MIVDRVAEHAALRVRGCKLENIALPQEHTLWSMRSSVKAMEEWTSEMSEHVFHRGSVLERFVYVFSVYMTSGWADEELEWCKDAVKATADWMSNFM